MIGYYHKHFPDIAYVFCRVTVYKDKVCHTPFLHGAITQGKILNTFAGLTGNFKYLTGRDTRFYKCFQFIVQRQLLTTISARQ